MCVLFLTTHIKHFILYCAWTLQGLILEFTIIIINLMCFMSNDMKSCLHRWLNNLCYNVMFSTTVSIFTTLNFLIKSKASMTECSCLIWEHTHPLNPKRAYFTRTVDSELVPFHQMTKQRNSFIYAVYMLYTLLNVFYFLIFVLTYTISNILLFFYSRCLNSVS